MPEFANGGFIPPPADGTVDRIPIMFADREQIIYPDGKLLCHHSVDGRFHDHGMRFDPKSARDMLDKLNTAHACDK